jgi:hypothetical protein
VFVQPGEGQNSGWDGVGVDAGQDAGAVLAPSHEVGRVHAPDGASDPVQVVGSGWVQDLSTQSMHSGLGHDRGEHDGGHDAPGRRQIGP